MLISEKKKKKKKKKRKKKLLYSSDWTTNFDWQTSADGIV